MERVAHRLLDNSPSSICTGKEAAEKRFKIASLFSAQNSLITTERKHGPSIRQISVQLTSKRKTQDANKFVRGRAFVSTNDLSKAFEKN